MTVIFLNGCTSAGKSSIAVALQDRLKAPYLRTGIDDAFRMIPARCHDSPAGFWFDRDARGLVRLNLGELGWATMRAYHQAVGAMLAAGIDLILDEVLIEPALWTSWSAVLAGYDVRLVGVHCDLAELERREVARGDRVIGQARGQIDLVHAGIDYDLEIDTTAITPAAAAAAIADFVESRARAS